MSNGEPGSLVGTKSEDGVTEPFMAPKPIDSIRSGLRVSVASLLWTSAVGATSIAIGLVVASVVLVAFGAIELVDAAGSSALVIHFRHALRHEAISARREGIALRVVTIGMATIGVATAGESIERLASGAGAGHDHLGVLIAGISVPLLVAFAIRKRNVGRAIPSNALRADGWLSFAGALLALVTLAGTALQSAFGWWWIDSSAATVVAVGAIVLSVVLARGGERRVVD